MVSYMMPNGNHSDRYIHMSRPAKQVTISKPAPTAPSLYVCLADECGRCCKVSLSLSLYIYIYIYVYTCIYIYIYVYTSIQYIYIYIYVYKERGVEDGATPISPIRVCDVFENTNTNIRDVFDILML